MTFIGKTGDRQVEEFARFALFECHGEFTVRLGTRQQRTGVGRGATGSGLPGGEHPRRRRPPGHRRSRFAE